MTHIASILLAGRAGRAGCAALLAVALVACGGGDDAPAPGAATATIAGAGGTLDGPGGSQLVVPPNALAAPTTVSIAQSGQGAPALPPGSGALGATFALTPHGTAFAVPVTIKVPFDPSLVPAGAVPSLYKTNAAQDGWDAVPGATVVGNTIQAQITGFSWTVPVVLPTLATIATPPADQSVVEPATATFTVGATGFTSSGVITYQWKRNGIAITGATGAAFTTGPTSVAADDGAVYAVEVTNLAGTVHSLPARLTVTAAVVAPQIARQPMDASVAVGASATFSAAVTGTSPVLQWQVSIDGGVSYGNVTGANAATLTVSNLQPTNSGARYRLVATNVAGSATSNAALLTVTAAPPPSGAAKIAAGDGFSFAVDAAGASYSWGTDGAAQLGNGPGSALRLAPTAMGTLGPVRSMSAGTGHGVAVLVDGTAWVWGYRGYIDCAAGATYETPVPLAGATNIVAASAGSFHTLLLRADGVVLSIGCNDQGALGRTGSVPPMTAATPVPGLPTIVAVAAGSDFSLALDINGFVWSWGKAGARGDASVPGNAPRATPMQVNGVNNIVAISAGTDHALALRNNGFVASWGSNDSGQLGDGTTAPSGFPTSTLLTTGIVAIAAGNHTSLAVRADGAVLTWGSNLYGFLGNGPFAPLSSATPGVVAGLGNVVAASTGVGLVHVLALRSDGSVWSWGANNYGQLGDGGFVQRSVPAPVPGLDLD